MIVTKVFPFISEFSAWCSFSVWDDANIWWSVWCVLKSVGIASQKEKESVAKNEQSFILLLQWQMCQAMSDINKQAKRQTLKIERKLRPFRKLWVVTMHSGLTYENQIKILNNAEIRLIEPRKTSLNQDWTLIELKLNLDQIEIELWWNWSNWDWNLSKLKLNHDQTKI